MLLKCCSHPARQRHVDAACCGECISVVQGKVNIDHSQIERMFHMATSPDGAAIKTDHAALSQSFDHLRGGLRGVAQDAADVARAGASELRDGASHAVDVAKDKLDDAAELAAEASKSFKDVVARHPIASIGIAAGVGIVLGMLIFRPRN